MLASGEFQFSDEKAPTETDVFGSPSAFVHLGGLIPTARLNELILIASLMDWQFPVL